MDANLADFYKNQKYLSGKSLTRIEKFKQRVDESIISKNSDSVTVITAKILINNLKIEMISDQEEETVQQLESSIGGLYDCSILTKEQNELYEKVSEIYSSYFYKEIIEKTEN